MHPNGENSNPQWDYQNNQVSFDGGDTFAPFTDMHRNIEGEFEAQDRQVYWNAPQHHEHQEPTSRHQPPLSIFQQDHLLTAELPLEDSSYGSYSMIGNEPSTMGYHQHHHYNSYASPFMPDDVDNEYGYDESTMPYSAPNYGQGQSPIMPDYHQNVFESNLMCVGGGQDDEEFYNVNDYYYDVL